MAGSTRNDWPRRFDGTIPSPSRTAATSRGLVGTRPTVPGAGRALRRDKESVLVLRTLELPLDSPRHKPLRMLDPRAGFERIETLERAPAPFLDDPQHGLLTDPGKQLQKMEATRDRLRLVEEPEKPRLVRPNDPLESGRQFALSDGGEILEADPPADVIDRGRGSLDRHEGDPGTHGQGPIGSGEDLEELELRFSEPEGDRFLMETVLGGAALGQVV